MSREEELLEIVKLLNKKNDELYQKYTNLLKQRIEENEKSNDEIMKAIIHNKALMCVVLSKLGMENDEIDKLNTTIYETIEKLVKEEIGEENGDEVSNQI